MAKNVHINNYNVLDVQMKPKGSLCRHAVGDCDLDEVCSGESGECPTDLYIKNGKSCIDINGEQGFCFNGDCPTRNKQCQVGVLRSGQNLSQIKSVKYEINSTNTGQTRIIGIKS